MPGRSAGRFVWGTLLFADVSGFTAMSERLAVTGREGAEEITAVLNRYFSTMLAVLRDHGGEVIKFGGGALLALFVDPGSATAAARSALAMQEAMADFAETETSQGVFPLRMKIGLRHGRFFAAQLGSAAGMEYALLGRDVNATAAAEGAAHAGEVLLDEATLRAIDVSHSTVGEPRDGECYVIQAIAAGAPAPPLPELHFLQPATPEGLRVSVGVLDTLAPFLPAGLLARLACGGAGEHEGENRLVAMLFCYVEGLGDLVERLGPGREPTITVALNHLYTDFFDAVRRFGGVVNKLDLAEHGDKLLALFGAPVAQEDDAERALRAALGFRDALPELRRVIVAETGIADVELQQRIGISFGNVYAGYVGSEWRREYSVMGDSVNLAARLMAASRTRYRRWATGRLSREPARTSPAKA